MSAVEWDVLAGVVGGDVVVPGSADYEAMRKPAMARFHEVRPAAIVRCETPADASAAVGFARRRGMPVSIRCGGHSVAGRSSGEGIVIDVTPMRSVLVGDGSAIVGAGVRLGELYEALYAHGVTIPAGCGPSVGIAGLTLGGGIGVLGRKYGLTCDRLRRAQVVLADGSVVECDADHDPDLFWALRGAGGGNFGVVTSFVFDTVAAPETTVFHLRWSVDQAVALIDSWQAWAPIAPDEVDATLRLATGAGAGRVGVDLFGAVLASEAEARERIGSFIPNPGQKPVSTSFRQVPYPDAKRYLNELDQHETVTGDDTASRGHLFAKSEFFRRELDRATIEAVVRNLTRETDGVRSREVAFMPWGGAYNRVAPHATAFPHRQELFLVQHLLELESEASGPDRDSAHSWLTRSWELLHPSGSGGVYPNFPDSELANSGDAYYGENYARLMRVKAAYDPDNIFRFHQSLS
ncbi:MAG: FAD-binding oxidoreductase [Solirubrobacterales bacterium]|nr:FAD-binding oxidoreductase [Solirubrobacterales bacterium]